MMKAGQLSLILESAVKVCDQMHPFLAHSHLTRLNLIPPLQKGSIGLAGEMLWFYSKNNMKILGFYLLTLGTKGVDLFQVLLFRVRNLSKALEGN